MRFSGLITVLALLAVTAGAAHAQDTYIHAGRLLADPASGRVEAERTIVVRADGRIAQVAPGYLPAPAGAKLIDLKSRFVLPGLIDSHVHILHEGNPNQRLETVTQSEADSALMGAHYAKKTLDAGFTTVADLGAGEGGDAIFALRDAIAAGRIPGPRILAAGSTLTPSGGHADVHGYRADVLKALARGSVCNGPEDCRRAVRQQIQAGADVIKVTATGGVLSNTRAGLAQQMTDSELKAIAETAHALGRRVTAHAHGVDGVNAALRAGFDSIEHGTYLDDESIRLFKQNGAYLVPTVLAGAWVAQVAARPDTYYTQAQREKALEVGPKMLDMLRRARAGRIKIAFGTDTGVSPHGMNAREAELWVEAGFTPIEVIRAATIVAADHLQLSAETGAIKVGMAGDIIAVDGDPTVAIGALKEVRFAMARGRVGLAP